MTRTRCWCVTRAAIPSRTYGSENGLGPAPSGTLAPDETDLGVDDLRDLPHPATPETIPSRNRFVAWSRRYLAVLAGTDAVIGAAATVVPAAISDTLRQWPYALPVLALVGMLVWPAAIALRHGYRRGQIGVGLDELGAVMRAGAIVVVASALPAGLIGNSLNNEFTFYALLKLVVVAVPLAVVLSLGARAVARQVLHRLAAAGSRHSQRRGRRQLRGRPSAQ